MLRKSTLAVEGPLKVAQAVKIPLLLDEEEIISLLQFLKSSAPHLAFYNTHGVCAENEGIYSIEEFVHAYHQYVFALKEKRVPNVRSLISFFSSALSATSDIFYEISLENQKRLIKPIRPPIQLQPHEIIYSEESDTFYSMVYSEKSITFGIQLSYPNLFQDPHTHEAIDVDTSPFFPNTALFKALRLWVRENTRATPFIVKEKRMNLPYRLGKKCFPWINLHPQLESNNICVQWK